MFRLAEGLPKLAWLGMLKASPRNWIVATSPARNSFTRLVFRFHCPGPNRILRPEFPKVNWPGALKAVGLNHRVMPGLSSSGLIPVASARVEYQNRRRPLYPLEMDAEY